MKSYSLYLTAVLVSSSILSAPLFVQRIADVGRN